MRAPPVIEVDIVLPAPNNLHLSYIVTGGIGDIVMPPVTDCRRGDELWQHTCFEAFIRSSAGTSYYEFNFAPSMQWAAYRFDDYRSGRSAPTDIPAPSIEVQSHPGCYTLQVAVGLDGLSDLYPRQPWRLNVSAVMEHVGGHKTYWALAHPPGKPDFHHADCFVHEFRPDAPP